MTFRFQIVQGPEVGREIVVRAKELVTVGRTERSDIVLENDPRISSKHCELDHRGDHLLVRDLGSTNGTYVDGNQIRESEVWANARLTLGSTEFQVTRGDRPTPEPGALSPGVPVVHRSAGVLYDSSTTGSGGVPLRPTAERGAMPPLPPQGQTPGNPQNPFASIEVPDEEAQSRFSVKPPVLDTPPPARPAAPAGPERDPISEGIADSEESSLSPFEDSHSSILVGGSMNADPSPVSDSDGGGNRNADAPPGPATPTSEPIPPPQAESAGSRDEDSAPRSSPILDVSREFQRFTIESCPSGLTLFRSLEPPPEAPEFHPSGLLERLSQQRPVALVLHFQRMQQDTPESLKDAFPVFDWLPPDAAWRFGPVLVDYPSLCRSDGRGYVDQLWGHDGCLAFLGHQPDQLDQHLRGLIHRGVPGICEDGAIFHYCWPSVLSLLLSRQSPDVAAAIFADAVDGVVLENPGGKPGWQILAGPTMGQQLEAVGFRETPSEPVVER